MKKILLSMLIALICSMLYADPFGLNMGWTLEEIAASGAKIYDLEEEDNTYICFIDVTLPHPELSSYIAVIDKEVGLYQITAIGFTTEENSEGIAIRHLYQTLRYQLSKKYGNPIAEITEHDYSDFDYTNWMKELRSKRLTAGWGGTDDSGIDFILLDVDTVDDTHGRCIINYLGINAMKIRARESKEGINSL